MPYHNYFPTKLFKENSSSALQQPINWIKFIKWDWQYYSRGRSNFQEVFRLIDSTISKRQGNQIKHSIKKYSIKGKVDWLRTPRNITSLDGSCYEAIDSSISQNIFSYLKMFSMQCRKNVTVEDNKNRMNIANFINIYTNIYMWC